MRRRQAASAASARTSSALPRSSMSVRLRMALVARVMLASFVLRKSAATASWSCWATISMSRAGDGGWSAASSCCCFCFCFCCSSSTLTPSTRHKRTCHHRRTSTARPRSVEGVGPHREKDTPRPQRRRSQCHWVVTGKASRTVVCVVRRQPCCLSRNLSSRPPTVAPPASESQCSLRTCASASASVHVGGLDDDDDNDDNAASSSARPS